LLDQLEIGGGDTPNKIGGQSKENALPRLLCVHDGYRVGKGDAVILLKITGRVPQLCGLGITTGWHP
jgi:hypothetical protein